MQNPANPFSFASVVSILKKTKPDIIHTHSSIDSWLVGSASKLLDLPVIRSRHISIPIKGVFPNNLLYSKIPRKIITSGEAISDIVKSVSGVKAKNVKSVSAGVDFKKFDFNLDSKKIRDELGIKPGQLLVGKIGGIRGWKGYDYLLEAAPIILKKYPEKNIVPRPDYWSGWNLNPNEIEFWLDGENRIHQRLKYIKNKDGNWNKFLLYP